MELHEACICFLSHYRLLVSEVHSQVGLCADMGTIHKLLPLIRLPVKDLSDFYSLGDIVANGRSMDGTMLNILAAVKSVGTFRQQTCVLKYRSIEGETRVYELEVFIQTKSSSYFIAFTVIIITSSSVELLPTNQRVSGSWLHRVMC